MRHQESLVFKRITGAGESCICNGRGRWLDVRYLETLGRMMAWLLSLLWVDSSRKIVWVCELLAGEGVLILVKLVALS